ncbi:type II toxin-antitoxin system YafQ family toxin [Caminibacter sp.]
MYKLKRHKDFVKDLKKVKITDSQFEKFINYVSKLLNNQKLPKEAIDHSLKGEWKNYREFHLGGDLIVIYKKDYENREIILVAIGTHSQIFKKM